MRKNLLFPVFSVLVILSLLLTAVPAQAATVTRSGIINGAETWTSNNLYLIDGDLTVASSGVLTIQAGTVVKVQPGFAIDIQGKLVLQGTNGNPVYFTSYYDDSIGGDTDGTPTLPTNSDWKGITLNYGSTPGSASFQYATVRYASTGVYLWNLSGAPVGPGISNNTFEFNQTGLILDASNGDITSTIQSNQFQQNDLGLQAQSTTLGIVLVDLLDNQFQSNTGYPLYLWGNSFPTYSSNTFSGNGYQGIAMGDVIDLSNPLEIVPANPMVGAPKLPYVVPDYLEVAQGTLLQFPAGLVMKFGTAGLLEAYGQLDLQGTSVNPVVFTSLHDDAYGGDTDGVVVDPTSDPWSGVELFFNGGTATSGFDNTIFRYSTSGLMVTNGQNTAYSPAIHDNTFELNGIGVNMLAGMDGNIQSAVTNNLFKGNQYGLVAASGGSVNGNALPAIQNNTFQDNTTFPLALQGSAFPTYSANIFTGNAHPAIAVKGQIHMNGTWVSVPGQGGLDLPYVLEGNYQVSKGYTLSIPAGTVVKSAGPVLNVQGTLDSQGSAGNPVVFTSYYDDSYGGNIDAAAAPAIVSPDAQAGLTPGRVSIGELGFEPLVQPVHPSGPNAAPAPGDWGGVAIYAANTIQHNLVRYAVYGLRLSSSSATPPSIIAQLNTLENNQYAIFVEALSGALKPSLQNNSISGSSEYPVLLQGSAFPTYAGNTFTGNLHPAIAVQGQIKANGEWPALTGQGIDLPYVIKDVFQVNQGVALGLAGGLVVKSGGPALNVYGLLDLDGAPANPIVFTSIKDDAYGGDTDGVAATPAPGDWSGVTFYGSGNSFHDARVRYAVDGVRIQNSSAVVMQASIEYCTIEYNQSGIHLNAPINGTQITAWIAGNQIKNNDKGVVAAWVNTDLGTSKPTVRYNSITGNLVGVENQQPNPNIDALSNWWGSATGPQHASNPGGAGDPVSDRVDFDPWQTAPAGYFKLALPLVMR